MYIMNQAYWNKYSGIFLDIRYFLFQNKYIKRCRLQNGGHFIPALVS